MMQPDPNSDPTLDPNEVILGGYPLSLYGYRCWFFGHLFCANRCEVVRVLLVHFYLSSLG
uniref:Uncharacterized protein n=1 Tax=Medicago truncatula TaxID=3880 RepID=A2Q4G1_MEDTR|nr:hypothetical protein MtrDRAFT_AC157473g29v2 [Medicago truncatula]